MKSAQHQRTIAVPHPNKDIRGVFSVSVLNGQLLLGSSVGRLSGLYVYSKNDSRMTTINLPRGDRGDWLYYSTWTRRGHIVCTYLGGNVVVLMSRSGNVLAETNIISTLYLSVSTDDVIYVTSRVSGVHQSTDDGVTWSHLLNSTRGWWCFYVIKVSTHNPAGDDFWTLEENEDAHNHRLRVYTVNRKSADGGLTWRDVTLPSHVHILTSSKLAHDGHMNIFLTDFSRRAVYVLRVNGQYDRELLSPSDFNIDTGGPKCLAVDFKFDDHVIMYIGNNNDDKLHVYTLIYE